MHKVEFENVTLYHADCMEVLPLLSGIDAVVTDPPYPDYHAELYGYKDGLLDFLTGMPCRQIIFWSAKAEFPLDYSAVHIWDKTMGVASQYEKIFERNGQSNYKMWRGCPIQNSVTAQMSRDDFTGHPSQKPITLMSRLIGEVSKTGNLIADFWMGSGSTGVACVRNGRKFIGVEKDAGHFATACKRIEQELSQGQLAL